MAQDGNNGNQGVGTFNVGAISPLATVKGEPASPCGSIGTMTPAMPAVSADSTDIAPAVSANVVEGKDVEQAVGADIVCGDGKDVVVPAVGADIVGGDGKAVAPTTVLGEHGDGAAYASNGKGKRKENAVAEEGDANPGNSTRLNAVLERERRKRMADNYTILQSMIPNIGEKPDKATVVAGTIKFIRHLEGVVQDLEKKKKQIAQARYEEAGAAALAKAAVAHLQACASWSQEPLVASGLARQAAAAAAFRFGAGSSSQAPQAAGVLTLQKAAAAATAHSGAGSGSWSLAPPATGLLARQHAVATAFTAAPAAQHGAGGSWSQSPPVSGILARQAAAAAAVHFGAGSSSQAPPAAGQLTTVQLALPQGWCWLPKKKAGEGAVAPPPSWLQTWSEPNFVLNVSGDDAYITLCMPRRPGLLTMVLSVLEKHHIDVITVQVGSDSARTMFSLNTRVNMEKIKQLDAEPPESKYIYQLAASEIMVWLKS